MAEIRDLFPPDSHAWIHIEVRTRLNVPLAEIDEFDLEQAVMWISDSIGTPHASRKSKSSFGKARLISGEVFDATRTFAPYLVFCVIPGGTLRDICNVLDKFPFKVRHLAVAWFANELSHLDELAFLEHTQRRLLTRMQQLAVSVKVILFGPDGFWGYSGQTLRNFQDIVAGSQLLLSQPFTCRADEFRDVQLQVTNWHIKAQYSNELASIFARWLVPLEPNQAGTATTRHVPKAPPSGLVSQGA